MFGTNSWQTRVIDIHFGQYYLVAFLVIGVIVGVLISQWCKECLHAAIKLIWNIHYMLLWFSFLALLFCLVWLEWLWIRWVFKLARARERLNDSGFTIGDARELFSILKSHQVFSVLRSIDCQLGRIFRSNGALLGFRLISKSTWSIRTLHCWSILWRIEYRIFWNQ